MMNQIGNNNNKMTNQENMLEIYFEMNEYIDSISKNIFSENDNMKTTEKKLWSIYSNLKKKLYRSTKPIEQLLRESPKETLEYLINRGAIENNPEIELYVNQPHKDNKDNKGNQSWWGDLYKIEKAGLTIKDPLISKVRFYVDPVIDDGDYVGLELANLEEGSNAKVSHFSLKFPKWRTIKEGLNIFGKCINSECEAFEKEVIYNVEINQKFCFDKQKKEIKCPICNKNFIPNTFGFWKCEYQIKGEKLKNGEYCKVDINGKETNGDDFEYFGAGENEIVNWYELSVFACFRQEMKYKA